MRYDFSLLQRAEDRMLEDRRAAEQHRLAKQVGSIKAGTGSAIRNFLDRLRKAIASAPAAPGAPGGSGNRWITSRKARKRAILAGAALITVASAASPAQAQSPAPSLVVLVRNVAESVLGENTVMFVKLADNGRTVMMRWESATYRPTDRLADAREILYSEALLATTAILSRMRSIVRIKFNMVRGSRILATGINHRGHGLSLVFSPELGGGQYAPPATADAAPRAPGAGASLQTR